MSELVIRRRCVWGGVYYPSVTKIKRWGEMDRTERYAGFRVTSSMRLWIVLWWDMKLWNVEWTVVPSSGFSSSVFPSHFLDVLIFLCNTVSLFFFSFSPYVKVWVSLLTRCSLLLLFTFIKDKAAGVWVSDRSASSKSPEMKKLWVCTPAIRPNPRMRLSSWNF